ncbi:MAG: alanine--tRNA ligase [Candidatus Omnitrophica bacterium]|nr:alanine--tRNA ligase [Candidatus Omnitrophota bacterium]
MKADILREKFLDFFKSKKHKIFEPDSLIPKDDPTVLFTPAGMNQFKKEFLGYDSGLKRVATCQRCLRTDDLEKVGKTPWHHTFFEMLGNFSFGDYFKEEAISFAWEFLTEKLKIKKERLWVSVYKDDEEAYNIWVKKIKILPEKIVKLGDKENFWPSEAKEKGPNGPCGPCSEIFFDWGKDTGCKRPECNPSCDCGRFSEIWNLVFTQFNRKEGKILKPLPKKNIDTGMGLERLSAVMQGVYNNFQTDLFLPIVKEIESKLTPEGLKQRELVYAIADHIRAISFAIYDGVQPSNEARGYVVRRLIRKSILNLRGLGIKQSFLYKLVPIVSTTMKGFYPQLYTRKENISEIILAEEEGFISTLNSTDTLFMDKFSSVFNKPDPELVGKISFNLYDTYGVPLELTKDWLKKHNIAFSQEAFDKELEAQKIRSRQQSLMKGQVFDLKGLGLPKIKTKFLGYNRYQLCAKILRIIKDAKFTEKIQKGESAEIILDKTPFYAESGGQVGDTGYIKKGKSLFEVLDTKRFDKVIIHIGKVKEGGFKKADKVNALINLERRLAIARNHTATHLLQSVLRKVLGEHVKQQGSLVAEDRLRFDFTHFKDLKQDQLERIEEIVNEYVIENHKVKIKQMSLSKAKKEGALAFFADKYEERVRVVSISDFSKELCGGTHLKFTGQIGLFKIIHEGSIASGIRRIEAVTGKIAFKKIKEEEDLVNRIASLLNTSKERIIPELQRNLIQIKELEKRLNLQVMEMLKASLDKLIREAPVLNGIKIITYTLKEIDIDLLRKTLDLIKEKTNNAVIALASLFEDKISLVMGLTSDLCQKGLDASKLINNLAPLIGGKGGGRLDFAQAGGNNPKNIFLVFEELKNIIAHLK